MGSDDKKRWNRWLVGCGAGCGCLLLGVIILIGSFAFWIGSMTRDFDSAVEAREAIEEQFGGASGYVPAADGSVAADRMEAFLRVRQATQVPCGKMARFFESIPDSDEEIDAMEDASTADQLAFAFRMMGGGMQLPTAMANLFRARNEALLAQQMSLGEYSYIYVLAYRSFLEHDPIAETSEEGHGISDELTDVGVYRRRIHGELVAMLRSQAESLPAETPPDRREALQAEIERMTQNSRAVPWEDGLPGAIRASFEPYRDRLRATYEPLCSEFDLGRSKKQGSASYTME